MHMEWLKRIRLGIKPLRARGEGERESGSMYQLAKAAGIGVTSYKNIEENPISAREKLLIAAWKMSGKTADVLLKEIQTEILEHEQKKISNTLKSLKQNHE